MTLSAYGIFWEIQEQLPADVQGSFVDLLVRSVSVQLAGVLEVAEIIAEEGEAS